MDSCSLTSLSASCTLDPVVSKATRPSPRTDLNPGSHDDAPKRSKDNPVATSHQPSQKRPSYPQQRAPAASPCDPLEVIQKVALQAKVAPQAARKYASQELEVVGAAGLLCKAEHMHRNVLTSSSESSPPINPSTSGALFHSRMHSQGSRISHTGGAAPMHGAHVLPRQTSALDSAYTTASATPKGCAVRGLSLIHI